MNICRYCNREYVYNRAGGSRKDVCASCRTIARRQRLKQKAVDYKGGKCNLCGYSDCLAALEFHHVDESTKSFTISGSHSRSWTKIQDELDKCVLICANCHAKIHYVERFVE